MPFDPTKPVNNSLIVAAELRDQFNGLKALDDAKLPATEKGAANGVASLDANGRLAQPADWNTLANKPAPVADGTYTVGMGGVTNGTITVVNGIITAIQEASNPPPPDVLVSGGGNDGYNGGYSLGGTNDGKHYYTKGAHVIWWRDFAGGQWIMSHAIGSLADTVYYHAGAEDEPWMFSWDVINGPAPAPTVTEN